MKIAQIVCTFPPYKGGIGNAVYNFAKYLAGHGENVTVFTPNYRHIGAEYNESFRVRRLSPFFKIGNAACIPQLFWKLKEFDVIHLHLPFIGGTLPILFYPKKKLVIHYHMDLVGFGAKKILFWLYKKLAVPLALWRADKIIVSSFDYIKNSDIAEYFERKREKFFELPFGVDAKKFCPKSKNESLMEKYFIEPDDKVVLFVGGLDKAHYFKGLDVLMRAAKEINRENIKLLVVGEGDMKAEYKDKAEEFGIAKRIIFAGSPNDAELPDYYNLADIFVLPSIDKSEAFGLVLLEAGACGKPLVASDLAGVRTVVWKNENGLLAEPNNSNDLADKIKQLLDNDELRAKMGANARQIVENNYCWKKVVNDLIEIYQ
ncbi:glycosyltransferase family 4 protein [Patescibacteria group bacterium]|nr:glycosyltransferase family 4 protein [Patescibacteria group bacterium]